MTLARRLLTAAIDRTRARIGRRVVCDVCRERCHDLPVHRYIDHGDEDA